MTIILTCKSPVCRPDQDPSPSIPLPTAPSSPPAAPVTDSSILWILTLEIRICIINNLKIDNPQLVIHMQRLKILN